MDEEDKINKRLLGMSTEEAKRWINERFVAVDKEQGEAEFMNALNGQAQAILTLTSEQEISLTGHNIVDVQLPAGVIVRDTFGIGGNYWRTKEPTQVKLWGRDVYSHFAVLTPSVETNQQAQEIGAALLQIPYRIK